MPAKRATKKTVKVRVSTRLTKDQRARLFVRAKAKGANQHDAAVAAGYKPGPGASAAASGMVQRADVREGIAKAALDADLETTWTVAQLLQAMGDAAFLDPLEFFAPTRQTKDGAWLMTLRELEAIPQRVRRCIESFDVVRQNLKAGDGITDEMVKVRWIPKSPVWRLMCEHKGILTQKIEIDLTVMTKRIEKWDDDTLAAEMAKEAIDEATRAGFQGRGDGGRGVGAVTAADSGVGAGGDSGCRTRRR